MVLGFGAPKPVAEHEADATVEQIYHDIRSTLRVTGVNLIFRTWASYERCFALIWDSLRPNLHTRIFEDAADRIRAEAVRTAAGLGPLNVRPAVRLGPSQTNQIGRALALYHYINPKLLVLTSTVQLALTGELRLSHPPDVPEVIQRGKPAQMYPMEMVPEEPDDEQLVNIFQDIKQTLGASSVNSDYLTLGLWPGYLAGAWERLKPMVGRDEYHHAAASLRDLARTLARSLPLPVPLSLKQLEDTGEDAEGVTRKTVHFEDILPKLILNIALVMLDWQSAETLARSPFPAETKRPPGNQT